MPALEAPAPRVDGMGLFDDWSEAVRDADDGLAAMSEEQQEQEHARL